MADVTTPFNVGTFPGDSYR